MATLPTPTGAANNPVLTTQTRTVAQWAAWFDTKYPGHGAGQGYQDYAAAHPSLTSNQAAVEFDLTIATEGIAKAISSATQELSKFSTTGASAVGDATKPFSLNGFLNGLTSRALWIRIAEGTVGILLIVIAVAKLAEGTGIGNAAKNVAKKAGVFT